MDFDLNTVVPLIGTFTLVAFLLAAVGIRIGRLLFPQGVPPLNQAIAGRTVTGWRRWFVLTLSAHPMIAGAFVGLSGLHAPEFLGDSLTGRCLWFAAAGVCALPIHSGIMARLDALDGIKGNADL